MQQPSAKSIDYSTDLCDSQLGQDSGFRPRINYERAIIRGELDEINYER